MGCVDQNFFEGLWDFISVFVEDDKCKERVGGRGMNERDENRDERRDSEEIAKRGTARIGDVNDMAKERSDDHSGGSDFFCFFQM
jgi:hypothetical protein